MDGQDKNWPAWRYGPNGQAAGFACEEDVPSGWVDHPSKVKGHAKGGGTQTATESANATVSEADAAKTTTAPSQTAIDPALAANSGVLADGTTAATGEGTATGDTSEQTGAGTGTAAPSNVLQKAAKPAKAAKPPKLDAHGHPWSKELHVSSKTQTQAGLWRMKPGQTRPAPAKGYPLDL